MVFFIVAILIAEVLFEQFLICTAVLWPTTKHNGYFTFQTIYGAHGAISDAVCVGSPVIIIIYKKS